MRQFKERVDGSYRRIGVHDYDNPLNIAKRLHDLAYASWQTKECPGYVSWKLAAIWFEALHRLDSESRTLLLFLEYVLLEISPDPRNDAATYQCLSPISWKWKRFKAD